MVQAGGGSVHVWGAFHNSAKSPLMLPDGYITGVLYRAILQNTLVPLPGIISGTTTAIKMTTPLLIVLG